MRYLLLLSDLALATGTAFAQTAISSCGSTISTSGDYQVTANLSAPGIDCIDITASNVILKLNGYQIVGMSGTATDGIRVSGSGRLSQVVIQGPGLLTGFGMGAALQDCDYCTVTQTTASGNSVQGIVTVSVTFLTLTSNIDGRNPVGISLDFFDERKHSI